jgi:formyltetrahydrofolate synthetase
VKKPFLIHEFTHNIKYQQSKFYNFGDDYFYCNTLNELDSKIKKYIFNKNYIQKKVEKLSKKIYGNMNINFNAKQKINFELTKMLN